MKHIVPFTTDYLSKFTKDVCVSVTSNFNFSDTEKIFGVLDKI